jgi:hypothetical protein
MKKMKNFEANFGSSTFSDHPRPVLAVLRGGSGRMAPRSATLRHGALVVDGLGTAQTERLETRSAGRD